MKAQGTVANFMDREHISYPEKGRGEVALVIASCHTAALLFELPLQCTLMALGSPLCSSTPAYWRLLSEPQKICDEDTWYHPRKNQVLLLLHMFVLGRNEASWLSGHFLSRLKIKIFFLSPKKDKFV